MKILFDIWAKAVDTQMHFNQMATKTRQLGLTFVVSALGLGVFLLGKGEDWQLAFALPGPELNLPVLAWTAIAQGIILLFVWLLNPVWFADKIRGPKQERKTSASRQTKTNRALFILFLVVPLAVVAVLNFATALPWLAGANVKNSSINAHVSLVLVVAAICALIVVWQVDLSVYHMMLRGAVTFGEDVEAQYLRPAVMDRLTKGMTEAISHYSRYKDASHKPGNVGFVYEGENRYSAYDKVRLFYFRTIALLTGVGIALAIYSNYQPGSVKRRLTKARINQFAVEAYPAWAVAHPGTPCPERIDDLADYLRDKNTTDSWGNRYQMRCGRTAPPDLKSGFGVLSPGPDGEAETDDDIRSW